MVSHLYTPSILKAYNKPEGGLALVPLLGNGASSRLTRSRALKRSAGRVGSPGHGSVGGSRGTGGGGSGISLIGERIEVLERHLEKCKLVRNGRRKDKKRSATETSWSR